MSEKQDPAWVTAVPLILGLPFFVCGIVVFASMWWIFLAIIFGFDAMPPWIEWIFDRVRR